jgi:hypothetical protein
VQVKDVSLRGVALLVNRRFEPGTNLVLELGESVSHSVSVLARVVRVILQADGRWLVGAVFFREINEEELAAFRTEETRQTANGRHTAVRVAERRTAVCRLASVGALGQWAAEVRDLSPNGLGLLLSFAVEEGVVLWVDLLPRDDQPARTEKIRVVRRERQPDGTWLHGCEMCPAAPNTSSGTGADPRRKPAGATSGTPGLKSFDGQGRRERNR